MTRDGSFVKIKNCSDFTVGCETDFIAAPQTNTRLIARVSSIAASFIIAFGIGWGVYGMPYSYVNIDINPSIQLTSNLFDRIIKVEALNADGKKLTASRHLDNMKLDDGMAEILDEAVKEGYIKNGEYNAVVFSVSSKNDDKSLKLEGDLKSRAESEFASDKVDSAVIVEKYSLDRLKDARELGISPGKLSLIEKLIEINPEMKVENLKDTSVREIMKYLKKEKADSKEKGDSSEVDSNSNAKGNSGQNGNEKQNGKGRQKVDETNSDSIIKDDAAVSPTPTTGVGKTKKKDEDKDKNGQDIIGSDDKKDNSGNNGKSNGKSNGKNNGKSSNNGKSGKLDNITDNESKSVGEDKSSPALQAGTADSATSKTGDAAKDNKTNNGNDKINKDKNKS